MLAHLETASPARRPEAAPSLPSLTAQEQTLVRLRAQRQTNSHIAVALNARTDDVPNLTAALLTRLGARTIAQAVALGVALEIVTAADLSPAPVHVDLPPRLQELVCLIASGCDDREAAQQLNVSPATFRSYKRTALERLGAADTVDAAGKATLLDLVPLSRITGEIR